MRITVEEITEAVCRHYNITKADIVSAERSHKFSHPRQMAMYLCRNYTEASMPFIGQRFGGRDHSTVHHAVDAIEERLWKDAATVRELALFKARLDERKRLMSFEAAYDRAWQTWAFVNRAQPTDPMLIVLDGVCSAPSVHRASALGRAAE